MTNRKLYVPLTLAIIAAAAPGLAQDRGVLAIDARSGRHAFSFSGEADAVNMCGTTDCEVVATFGACLGVAASEMQGGLVWSWAEAVEEGDARVGALEGCQSAGGPVCEVLNVYCVDVATVEAGLGLDRSLRRVVQQRLGEIGFNPGGADGLFGPRTRAAIQRWQVTSNVPATGYLTAAQLEALRGSGSSLGSPLVTGSRIVAPEPSVAEVSEPEEPDPDPEHVEVRLRPGDVFRDCDVCPEMVVLPSGRLALGRYEVTVGEYRAFASATGAGAGDCLGYASWRNPPFSQTDRHPVTCVSWDDVQEYVLWLSRTTGATYRLPTEAEWERAAVGAQPGCYRERTGNRGTCPVGSYGSNTLGLSDMVGNLWEWTEDCTEGDCSHRVLRGGSWSRSTIYLYPGARDRLRTDYRDGNVGIRVLRMLE